MIFSISSSELADKLQVIGKVITTKNQMSILDCFLFEIQGNQLTVTASDNENTMIATMALLESSEDYRFAINAKTVLDAVKGIPEQPVQFEIEPQNYKTTLKYQNGFFTLVGRNADEYPSHAQFPEENISFTVGAPLLLESVTRALFATASDTSHPSMTGILFDITAGDPAVGTMGNVSIVASDGRKLEYTRWPNEDNIAEGRYILAAKPATLLRNLLPRESGEVTVRLSQSKIEVRMNSFCLTGRLLDGRFPAYDKVVPQNNPNHLVVNRMAFVNMLRRVLVFADQQNSLVKLQVSSDQLEANVQDLDYSLSAKESMMCEYDGMPMNIGLKGTTLVDFINNIECENVELQIADQSRAIIITPSPQPKDMKDEEGNQLHKEEIIMLLMPSIINN